MPFNHLSVLFPSLWFILSYVVQWLHSKTVCRWSGSFSGHALLPWLSTTEELRMIQIVFSDIHFMRTRSYYNCCVILLTLKSYIVDYITDDILISMKYGIICRWSQRSDITKCIIIFSVSSRTYICTYNCIKLLVIMRLITKMQIIKWPLIQYVSDTWDFLLSVISGIL